MKDKNEAMITTFWKGNTQETSFSLLSLVIVIDRKFFKYFLMSSIN